VVANAEEAAALPVANAEEAASEPEGKNADVIAVPLPVGKAETTTVVGADEGKAVPVGAALLGKMTVPLTPGTANPSATGKQMNAPLPSPGTKVGTEEGAAVVGNPMEAVGVVVGNPMKLEDAPCPWWSLADATMLEAAKVTVEAKPSEEDAKAAASVPRAKAKATSAERVVNCMVIDFVDYEVEGEEAIVCCWMKIIVKIISYLYRLQREEYLQLSRTTFQWRAPSPVNPAFSTK
jgi:hypothetical protein